MSSRPISLVEDSYVERLNVLLNTGEEEGGSWEVLNFGISGYDARRMVKLFDGWA